MSDFMKDFMDTISSLNEDINNHKPEPEPELNIEIINQLYSYCKTVAKIKLYPTSNGTYKILNKDRECLDECYDIYEAKIVYINLIMENNKC